MQFLAKLHHCIVLAFIFFGTVDVASLAGYLSWIPPKWAAWATGIILALQQIYSVYNRYHNPDGTSARQAWRPPAG